MGTDFLKNGKEWFQQVQTNVIMWNNVVSSSNDRSSSNHHDNGNNNNNNDNESLCKSLGFRERMIGFATCTVGGFILSFGSFIKLIKLMTGNPIPFVTTYTLGNIVSLAGSCFLMGPPQQYRAMFHKTRIVATTVYLSAVFLTVVVVILAQVKATSLADGTIHTPALLSVVILLLMVFQWLAVTWYCLSYVPFARELILKYVWREEGDRDQYQQII